MRNRLLLLILATTVISCTASNMEQQQKIAQDTKELGIAYFLQGDYTKALKKLLEAEKVLPEDPYLQNDLGHVFMARKRYQMAEVHFLKAVTLKPDYVPAKNNLGSAYLKQEKWDLAINCFKDISGSLLYATPHFPLSNLGWSYMGKKEYQTAKKYFHRALKIKPDFINAVHGMALSYLETNQPSAAQKILIKAIQKRPETAILHADLAKSYETLRHYKKARLSWQMVLELAPGSELAQKAEARLDRE